MIVPGPSVGHTVTWNDECWTLKRFLGGKVLLWRDDKRDKQAWVNAEFIAKLHESQERVKNASNPAPKAQG